MRKTVLFIFALCATMMAWGEDKTITETYDNASTSASETRVSFKSSFDENFTVWQRGGRSNGASDTVAIGGKAVKGFWLSRKTSNSCYIEWGETSKQYLGGVKSVSFAYKQFGSEANHTMILDIEVNGEQVDRISFPAETTTIKPTHSYSKDLNAKKLTKLTIRNSSTAPQGTTVNGRFVVGPVTITPYLYCPSSAQNVQYKVSESATYVNPDFIDNTDGEAVWSCAPEGIVTVADGVVTPIEGKSGNVVITATLNDIEVSYNLEVITSSEPEEEVYVETFDKLPDETKSSTSDRTGDWYTWKITTGARHKTTDVLYNGTRSLWLASNGGVMETTIEGGVKRVSFLWNKFNKTASPVKVSVTAGDITRELEKEVQTGDDYNQNHPDLVFNSNFGIKSNTNLKITNPQTTTALQIGPIAITPYIFYIVKDTLIDITEVATFTNDKFIDNRDDEVAIVYSIVGENDGVATINAETGEVTGLKAGTVTVQAAYGEAKTTYTLKIHQKIDDGIVRILGIGNSFTQDALEAHIMPIILGQGKKAIVGYPYLGGCWQSRHVQNYKNDTKAYNYYKIDEEGNMTSTGANGASLKQAITDEPWDYVFIQSDHDSTGIVKSYMPYIKEIMAAVQTSCSNKDVKIGMYMTWAYDSTSTRSAFAWYNNDSQTMYDSIINATQIVMDYADVTVDMLIPAGTAIQNARTSYKGHTMNRDGYHLNYDYGRYIASLCYYSRIFGEDPKNVVYKPTAIDDYCADMCRAAAHAAMEKPFEVTDLVDYKEPTPPSPTKLNQTKGEELKVYKVVKDNQVLFVSGETTYNIFGQQIQ